jgi:DNA-binding transcriptional regulator YiaG
LHLTGGMSVTGVREICDEWRRFAGEGDDAGLRVTELPPPAKPLTPHQIRAIRKSFNVSQAVFARIINVSPNAVESWEQGVRRPREATLKLLTIAHKHPEVLLAAE